MLPSLPIFAAVNFFDAMSQCLKDLKDLKEEGISYEIVFIEASDQALVRRYKETRRVHPLALTAASARGLPKNENVWLLCGERPILLSIRLICSLNS